MPPNEFNGEEKKNSMKNEENREIPAETTRKMTKIGTKNPNEKRKKGGERGEKVEWRGRENPGKIRNEKN